jgi:hypothetical protein
VGVDWDFDGTYNKWTITFYTAPGDVDLLAVTTSTMSSGPAIWTSRRGGGTPHVLRVELRAAPGSDNDIGSSTPLEWALTATTGDAGLVGVTTAPIKWDATPENVRAAMFAAFSHASLGFAGVFDNVEVSIETPLPADSGVGGPAYSLFIAFTAAVAAPLPSFEGRWVAGDAGDTVTATVVQAYDTAHVFGNATDGLAYSVAVAAWSDAGHGEFSPRESVLAVSRPAAPAAPVYVNIGPTAISLAWAWDTSVLASGGSPVTGFRVFAFPGVAAVTQADPFPVKQEVQVVALANRAPADAVQTIAITGALGGSFALRYVSAATGLSFRTANIDANALSASAAGLEAALRAFCAVASGGASGTATVPEMCAATVGGVSQSPPGSFGAVSGTLLVNVSFPSTFGPLATMTIEPDLLETAGGNVTATVTTTVVGGAALGGDFTLSFAGSETVALPVAGLSAGLIANALDNLNTIGVVSVSLDSHDAATGAAAYAVTFITEVGDVPQMLATGGRLTGAAPTISVTTRQSGSAAFVAFDGVAAPNARAATVSGLLPGNTYAFKVAAMSADGLGEPSPAATTVVARVGAAAPVTRASG